MLSKINILHLKIPHCLLNGAKTHQFGGNNPQILSSEAANFESTAIINKPAEAIYNFLADLNNHEQLMPKA